jgi:Metallo-beta-lactamase superfamily
LRLGEFEELDPALLYVFLFGPGLGESIMVRVPPDHWAVIDSLRRHVATGERNPALQLLERFDASPEVVVLTHPHLDHADGLPSLLARRRPGALVGCALHFIDVDRDRESPDAEAVWQTGAAALALSAIADVWEREPAARLVLRSGMEFPVGPATAEVLFPISSGPSPIQDGYDLNRLSSPMLIRWEEASILLGARSAVSRVASDCARLKWARGSCCSPWSQSVSSWVEDCAAPDRDRNITAAGALCCAYPILVRPRVAKL